MVRHISSPLAYGRVTWLAAEAGGRRTGPPAGPHYAATAVFLGVRQQLEGAPSEPHVDEHWSILLEWRDPVAGWSGDVMIDFLAKDLVAPLLAPGVRLGVMEGTRLVGEVVVTGVAEANPVQPPGPGT